MTVDVPLRYGGEARIMDMVLPPGLSPRRKRRLAIAATVMIVMPVVVLSFVLSATIPTLMPISEDHDEDEITNIEEPMVGLPMSTNSSSSPTVDGPRDDVLDSNGTVTTTKGPETEDDEVPEGHFKVTGTVRNQEGPVPGALVVMSNVHIEDMTDLEIVRSDDIDLWNTTTLADGSYILPPGPEHGADYWIMAYAAFHTCAHGKIKVAEGRSTLVDLKLDRVPLRWTIEGYIERSSDDIVLDLLGTEGQYVRHGLGSALIDRTLWAEVTWDNSVTKGGDLWIGYVTSCSEHHSDQSIQYPSSKGNAETLTLRLDEQAIDTILGDGSDPVLDVVVGTSTWARDCGFTLNVVIE